MAATSWVLVIGDGELFPLKIQARLMRPDFCFGFIHLCMFRQVRYITTIV
jgi:hypothetical protein